MKKAYDRSRASLLVPLLESITREIGERMQAIRALEARVENLSRKRDLLNLQAELAVHRRELRLAFKECERLGCVVEEWSPTRILIPGIDGNLDGGFRWQPGAEQVEQLTSDPQTA